MGMFMTSLSFRCTKEIAENVVEQLGARFRGIQDLTDNLDSDGPGYAILSPFGMSGNVLLELQEDVSKITGGYAVLATCVDSDFSMLALCHNGEILDECYIGELYEEYQAVCPYGKPDLAVWKKILLDESQEDALKSALYEEEVLSEDQLRKLSALTGMPIFDDEMMMESF